jgi:hypothetical protein
MKHSKMPPRRYNDPAKRSVPEEFRATLEEAYEITNDPDDVVLTYELKLYLLERRPEWAVFSPPWWSINLTKIGVGNAHKHYPVRTGIRKRALS